MKKVYCKRCNEFITWFLCCLLLYLYEYLMKVHKKMIFFHKSSVTVGNCDFTALERNVELAKSHVGHRACLYFYKSNLRNCLKQLFLCITCL